MNPEEVLLTKEQNKVLRRFTKQMYASWMQRFWAWETLQGTLDGESISITNIEYENGIIYPATHCRCGQGIKHIFTVTLEDLTEIGPIGSTCIETYTGLGGQDVRQIINGSAQVNREKQQIVDILIRYGSFDSWADSFELYDKKRALNGFNDVTFSSEGEMSIVRDLLEVELPLLPKLAYAINRAWWSIQAKEKYEQFLNEHPEYREIIEQANVLIEDERYKRYCTDAVDTLDDLTRKLNSHSTWSGPQLNFAQKLVAKLNEQTLEAMIELNDLKELKLKESSANLVADLSKQGIKYGLSPAQCSLILDEDRPNNKTGLIYQFQDELNSLRQEALASGN